MTKKYGVIAHPVEHSLSPEMHNAAFKALNIDATFEKFDVSPEKLGEFMQTRNDLEGLAISIPHKSTILPFLDDVDEFAAKIKAVNTLYKKDGKLWGANTDAPGFLNALKEVMPDLVEKRVMVIGAGGAARAIIAALKPLVNSVTIINRTVERGVELAKEMGCRYGGKIEDMTTETPDLIVNATSIGLEEQEEPNLVPEDFIDSDMVIFDIVYRRDHSTKLIEHAKARGATTITGREMLLHQGMLQFELWTGQKAPKEIMSEALQ